MTVILGVESTAHTFGMSLVRDGEVIDQRAARYETETGGMVPFDVAEHHRTNWFDVAKPLFNEADEIDAVAYSQGPGIGQALRIGGTVAKSIASRRGLPLVPVNHCVAHLEVGRWSADADDPVLLYVSGANTQVIAYEGGRYRVFGETLDMGVGNFLDSLAREFGFGFPGGPRIEEAAEDGEEFLSLPYSVKGMDVSLGGLFTKAKRMYHNEGVSVEDLSYSVQETVFAMLTEITERALSHTGKDAVVLGGGVVCNDRLQNMVATMCEERGASMHAPDPMYLRDNAGMIGVAGEQLLESGHTVAVSEAVIKPKQRTDDVAVPYR
jgi:glycoprotease/Kae1 family metallohydrolase